MILKRHSILPTSAVVLGLIIPTIAVLWFMLKSFDNEKIAIQENLNLILKSESKNSVDAWVQYWSDLIQQADEAYSSMAPSETFNELVSLNYVSTAVVHASDIEIGYPNRSFRLKLNTTKSKKHTEGQKFEFSTNEYQQALNSYQDAYKDTTILTQKVDLLMAIARCHGKLKNLEMAVEYYQEALSLFEKSIEKEDSFTRRLDIDIQIRIIEILSSPNKNSNIETTIKELRKKLNNYKGPRIESRQRLAAMKHLKKLSPNTHLPTLDAEILANSIVSSPEPEKKVDSLNLVPINSQSGLLTLYAPKEALLKSAYTFFNQRLEKNSFKLVIIPASQSSNLEEITRIPLPQPFSDLSILVRWDNENGLQTMLDTKLAIYFWTGILITIILIFSSIYLVLHFRIQEKSNQLKNNIVATVSHELKTPLTSIRLLVENILASSIELDKNTREYIEIIDRENNRLTHLVDNFLTYSRMERGKHRIFLEPISVTDLVMDSIDTFKSRREMDGTEMSAGCTEDLWIDADSEMLKTALLNLLDNAWKYSTTPKKISILVHKTQEDVVIRVCDNGIGMSVREQKKIFDRFYRADQHLHRKTEGVGLGLSIVQYILEHHNASISVESKREEGTIFSLTFKERI